MIYTLKRPMVQAFNKALWEKLSMNYGSSEPANVVWLHCDQLLSTHSFFFFFFFYCIFIPFPT